MTPPPDSPPRKPLVPAPAPRPRVPTFRDTLPSVPEEDAREAALRSARAEVERLKAEAAQERAAREQAEQRLSAVPFPPPVVQAPPAPAHVEVDTGTAELVARGYRKGLGWGAILLGILAALGLGAGVGGVAGGQVALNPRPAKEANLQSTDKDVRALARWRDVVHPWQRGDYADRSTKELLLLDWACQQGFRAAGVNCAELRELAKEAARKGETPEWPAPRKPPTLPDPEVP